MRWLDAMGISEENREIQMTFDGNKIILEKLKVEDQD